MSPRREKSRSAGVPHANPCKSGVQPWAVCGPCEVGRGRPLPTYADGYSAGKGRSGRQSRRSARGIVSSCATSAACHSRARLGGEPWGNAGASRGEPANWPARQPPRSTQGLDTRSLKAGVWAQ